MVALRRSAAVPAQGADDTLERETMARVTRRLLPLLMCCYFAAYLDRVNVSFAALTMNQALGFSAAVFGIGSGIFFVGYFLFEIPSNLFLEKVGARRWIARILITWGIISGLTALVWGAWSFYGIRFLLGIAEAGFYPGIILYLTWWFPAQYRSRIIGIFMTAIPISIVTGSIISSQILSLHGWLGVQGWQWLFILEAIPTVVLGFVVMFYLTDNPAQAHWLQPEQRAWLTARLDAERAQREAIHHYGLGETLRNGRVWLLTLVYFGQNVSGYGFALFLPQIVKRFGVSIAQNRSDLCHSLRLRCRGYGAVGAAFRPHGRAQQARRGCLLPHLCRPCGLRVRRQPDHHDGGAGIWRRWAKLPLPRPSGRCQPRCCQARRRPGALP